MFQTQLLLNCQPSGSASPATSAGGSFAPFPLLLTLLATFASAADRQTAIKLSLPLLQRSAAKYIEERSCFTCHHQALPAITISLARQHGFQVDDDGATKQTEFTLDYFRDRKEMLTKGKGVPGGSYTAGYALVSLAADKHKPCETTDAIVSYLLGKQSDDGRWRIQTRRPPLESSHFTATALSLRGLQLYARDESAKELDDRIKRARKWLESVEPKTNEDVAFHLAALRWSVASQSSIDKSVELLLERQQKDGGWAQDADMASDAYATGQSLVAIQKSSTSLDTNRAVSRGIQFLLETQKNDGSWFVATRNKPIQTYFESDFPHDKSQFISISATCFATMALLLADESKKEPMP